MKTTEIYDKDFIDGIPGEYKITRYYGKDALGCTDREDVNQFIKEWLGKDCITVGGKRGVVIGFEDNEPWCDYYLIVYIPETQETLYELDVNPIEEI